MVTNERNKAIIRCALFGITANLLLFGGKLITGLAIKSNVVVLDAVNSLSDSISAVFIIVSTLLAMRRADKVHPFGYGRIEYIVSLLFAMFIMYVGGRGAVEGIIGIFEEKASPQYNTVSVIIMAASFGVKIFYGLLARKEGKRLSCPSLVLSGTDSLGDSFTALAILAGIIAHKLFGWNIEDYLCVFVGLMIFRTGFNMIGECLNKILGSRVDPEFCNNIKEQIIMQDGVLNVSNLVVHDYGEGTKIGSVDIEVDSRLCANDICRISNSLKDLCMKEGLVLTSVGISGSSDTDPETDAIWEKIVETVGKYKSILRAHTFVIDPERKEMSFYIVEDYDKDPSENEKELLLQDLMQEFPSMSIDIHSSINAL
ncbi:MAG: cation transporter [Spirochaetales bacterium]|nr:cation transporter [Spirochaetales bacterium]